CGRVADALALLERAVEQGTAMRHMRGHALQVAGLGEVSLLAGRLEDASQCAERALMLAHIHKECGTQAYVLRLFGEVAAHHNPPAAKQAEVHYRQALTLAEELGMRPLQAH